MTKRGSLASIGALLGAATLLLGVASCGGGATDEAAPRRTAIAPIPAPTGAYPVGTLLLDVDDTRPRETLPEGLPRTIAAQVWYPALSGEGRTRMRYFPRPNVVESMIRDGYFEQTPETIVGWSGLVTHAIRDPLPAVAAGGFPLLLFSPGQGVAMPHYTALLQELASRGFIVIGVAPRVPQPSSIRRTSTRVGPTATDEDVARRAEDLSLVLRRFIASTGTVAEIARRADLTRAGAFGHSIGGAAALEACAREVVLRRCANLDGGPLGSWQERGVPRPVLMIRSSPDYSDAELASRNRTRAEWDRMDEEIRAAWQDLLSRPDAAGGAIVRVLATSHMSFSDAPFVMPETLTRFGGRYADPARVLDATATLLEAFFGDETGDPAAAAEAAASGYEGLVVES